MFHFQQYSTDGERNNERSVARSRRRNANNREVEGASGGGSGSRRPRSNRNNNTEHGVSEIMQTRHYSILLPPSLCFIV